MMDETRCAEYEAHIHKLTEEIDALRDTAARDEMTIRRLELTIARLEGKVEAFTFCITGGDRRAERRGV